MQNLAKRQWGPSITMKESADLMVEWCIRAREKNVLRKKPPKIYYAYVIEGTPPIQFMQSISSIFKYSQKDSPYVDLIRDILLREMSVALKAHFFMFSDDRVAHEPYFFTIPSLEDLNQTIVGLVYKIEKENKTIVVFEKELKILFDANKIIYEFPTVVIEDSYKWFSVKNWNKIKLDAKFTEKDGKPWVNKHEDNTAKEAKTKEALEEVATILDVPFDIKDSIKPLGIEWNKFVKTWYLPKGFDVDSVSEYLNYIKKTQQN